MLGVERARHLQRDDPGAGRRGGGERGEGVERACRDHLAAAVHVRRDEAVLGESREHLVRVTAQHRAHAGRGRRRGAGHRGAAHGDEAQGLVVGQDARDRRRGELTDRVAGGHPDDVLGGDVERLVRAEVEDGPQARQRGGHEQRLRHGGVADGVGVRRGAVGDEIQAGRAGGPRDRLGDGRQLEPRGEHAGGLGALTGADDSEHPTTLPGRERPTGSRRAPTLPDSLVRLLQPAGRADVHGSARWAVGGGVAASSRPSARAVCRTYDSRASSGSQPVTSATRRRR